jgi:hypothetical protein
MEALNESLRIELNQIKLNEAGFFLIFAEIYYMIRSHSKLTQHTTYTNLYKYI